MREDEKIIELFFERSEQAIQELDTKYGKICKKLSYNIVNDRLDAEECVNDAYLGVWNAFEVVSLELKSERENEITFSVCVSKGGAVQEPDRTIILRRNNGTWEVINEGY